MYGGIFKGSGIFCRRFLGLVYGDVIRFGCLAWGFSFFSFVVGFPGGGLLYGGPYLYHVFLRTRGGTF